MNELSPELIMEIFSHLSSTVDLANFRLVQRDFAELGSKYLFRVVHIRPTKRGLQPLIEVSRRAALTFHVRKVVLHLEDFRHSIWLPLRSEIKPGNGAGAQNSRTFAKAFKEVDDFQRSSDYIDGLASFFRCLLNLNTIEVKEMPSCGYLDSKVFNEILQRCQSQNPQALYQQWGAPPLRMGAFRAFSALVGALESTDVKVLSFKSNSRKLFDGPSPKNQELLDRSKTLFKDCRVMKLGFHPDDLNGYLNLLISATKLKKLTLNFNKDKLIIYDNNSTSTFRNMQERCCWPNLKELKLKNAVIPSAKLLLEFLKHLGQKLRVLVLKNCELYEGSWKIFFTNVNDITIPNLECLELNSLLDHSACDSMSQWHNLHMCLGYTYSKEELSRLGLFVLDSKGHYYR